MPLPFCVSKDWDSVVSTWFTQCNSVWLAHAMPCHAATILCLGRFERKFSRPQHGMAWHGMCEWTYAVSWWPVGDVSKFNFFWLPRGHAQKSSIRMLSPFGCFQSPQWWWRKQIIQQNTFWWTNLKVKTSLSSVVMLCLYHAFFFFFHYLCTTTV